MREELSVAYDNHADLRDRVHSLQQQLAAMKAEAAARTPVGVTIEKVLSSFLVLLCTSMQSVHGQGVVSCCC